MLVSKQPYIRQQNGQKSCIPFETLVKDYREGMGKVRFTQKPVLDKQNTNFDKSCGNSL